MILKCKIRNFCNTINPFKLHAPKVDKKHKELMNTWDTIKGEVKEDIKDIYNFIPYPTLDLIKISIEKTIRNPVLKEIEKVIIPPLFSGEGTVWEDVSKSLDQLVWACMGYLFRYKNCLKWYKLQGEYHCQCCINLLKEGFVPIEIWEDKYLWSKDRGLERVKYKYHFIKW
jgi:hypothetical protein